MAVLVAQQQPQDLVARKQPTRGRPGGVMIARVRQLGVDALEQIPRDLPGRRAEQLGGGRLAQRLRDHGQLGVRER